MNSDTIEALRSTSDSLKELISAVAGQQPILESIDGTCTKNAEFNDQVVKELERLNEQVGGLAGGIAEIKRMLQSLPQFTPKRRF